MAIITRRGPATCFSPESLVFWKFKKCSRAFIDMRVSRQGANYGFTPEYSINPLMHNGSLLTRPRVFTLHIFAINWFYRSVFQVILNNLVSNGHKSMFCYFIFIFFCKENFRVATPLSHNMGHKWPILIFNGILCMAKCFYAITFQINLFYNSVFKVSNT